MRVPEAEIRQQILESVISLYSSVDEQIRDGMDSASKSKPGTLPSYRFTLLTLSEALSLITCAVACLCCFLIY